MRKNIIIGVFILVGLVSVFVFFSTSNNKVSKQVTSPIQTSVEKPFFTIKQDDNTPIKPEEVDWLVIPSSGSGKTIIENIISILGEPLEKKQLSEPARNNPNVTVYYDKWTFSKTVILLYTIQDKNKPAPEKPGELCSISTTDSILKTKMGISVGDPVKKLFELYKIKDQKETGRYDYGLMPGGTVKYEYEKGYITKISNDNPVEI